jgi:hypothetical protein
MLHQIQASDFQALLGSTQRLRFADGRTLALCIDEVDLKPQSQMPGSRMPFSVALSTTGQTDVIDGLCALEMPGAGTLENLFVSRVPNLGRDPANAYFQIVFN